MLALGGSGVCAACSLLTSFDDFDDAMKKQVLGMFHEQLAEDGTLFIGHSETIRSGEAPFTALPIPQGFCYRKDRRP